jgi:hypothetical protein
MLPVDRHGPELPDFHSRSIDAQPLGFAGTSIGDPLTAIPSDQPGTRNRIAKRVSFLSFKRYRAAGCLRIRPLLSKRDPLPILLI